MALKQLFVIRIGPKGDKSPAVGIGVFFRHLASFPYTCYIKVSGEHHGDQIQTRTAYGYQG
jgi:hypothetical protein